MPHSSGDTVLLGHRYALCVGIGTYTNLRDRNLRFAVADAIAMKKRLESSLPDSFKVTLHIEPAQTSKAALNEAVEHLLSAPDRQAEDLAILYFSCHGDVCPPDNTFCLLPSNASLQADGMFEPGTLIGISDFARWFSKAKTQNIVILLDVCHSGGAGVALQHFKLDLAAGPNFFIIGAARQDQVTRQSSLLQHGLFTHCLLRAFEQSPTKDGWLTVSQIHNFVSDEISWFAKDQPTQIQSWSVSVNPNLPLLRNPRYPELCPLPPLWNVPLQRNMFFTGQEGLLVQLATMLQNNQKTALTQQPQAVTGLGGIGKTQLALEYAYRHRQDYHAVLWGRADTREALISTFMDIASLLELPEKDEQDQMVIVEAVKTWLKKRSSWLFILDNADELAIVKEFIPPAFQGHLLLTTRAQAMGRLAYSLEVEVMQPETGALLLLRRAGLLAPVASLEQAAPANVTIAKELSEEMGGLPLALDQAGAYIEETRCGLLGYRRLYQTERESLLQRRGGLNITNSGSNSPSRLRSFFRHPFQPPRAPLQESRGISVVDHPEPVATTWSLSFAKVKQANAAAAELLQYCAFLHPDAIPEELIMKGAAHLGKGLRRTAAEPSKFNEAIEVLGRYSLLRRNPTTNTLTIHRLVQAVLRTNMTDKTQHEWAKRTVRAVNLAFPDVTDVALWEQCELYLPHALMCATLIDEYTLAFPEATRLLDQTASYFFQRGDYPQAELLLQQALMALEQQLGLQRPYTAKYLYHLGKVYLEQYKYEQAEPLLKQALAIYEQLLGFQHPQVAASLLGLAVLYEEQGKYSEAEPLLKRTLAIYEQQLGPEHPITVATRKSYHVLVENMQQQGKEQH
jgi:tetratricopeptide (TPR) repeat protein